MEAKRVETQIGRETLTLETGRMARQAHGSVLVQYADTVVLVTACASPEAVDMGYFPLRVDYREMTYAAGKIPGGFFKREGRPTTKEVLTCRLMDRPIRPLFPDGYMNEVQVIGTVLSADRQNDPDVLSMIGASASLLIAPNIPFSGPTGTVRVGRVNGEWLINPTHAERAESDVDLIVSGTEDAITMIEGCAQEISEAEILEAVKLAEASIAQICRLQKQLAEAAGIDCTTAAAEREPNELLEKLDTEFSDRVYAANGVLGKFERRDALEAVKADIIEKYAAPEGEEGPRARDLSDLFDTLEKKALQKKILTEGIRGDGRKPDEIRTITCEVGVLPRVHGSALFTRGETQALVACTLGTTSDEQRVDGLEEEYKKKFMLHYNFPPFCVGEVKFLRGASRRELGHGHLAETSLQGVLPGGDEFPYTLRLVSDIMESNGSSSMASVCGGTLCLMDAGVPIKRPVAGIAMGMIQGDGKCVILSDIAGEEDHCGCMDLKVTGTENGITAIQMDLKISGITSEELERAFAQAKEGRMHILGEMLKAIAKPREAISEYAPRLLRITINPEKIGMVIGPGGKVIRALQEATGSNIEIEDDGTVTISSLVAEGAEAAKARILAMTEEPEVGRIYEGTVATIKDFGAFVEILPGTDGLVHISEMSDGYVKDVASICAVGDKMRVKLIEVDSQGRIRLSRKAALKEEGKQDEKAEPRKKD